jgi:hypothetical protein
LNLWNLRAGPVGRIPLQKFAKKKVIKFAKSFHSMPLKKGLQNIGKNIRELMQTGRSQAQSTAIALRVAGKKKRRL